MTASFLLDTHVFLWWITAAPELSPAAREVLAPGRNRLVWSAASSWEVAIKFALGRLPLPLPPGRLLPEHLARNRVEGLPVLDAHAWRVAELPVHHRDPFDRLLVAQAQVEGLTIVSADAQLRAYDVPVIW